MPYRNGLSGVHSFGFGTGSTRSRSGAPDTVPTFRSPSHAVATTRSVVVPDVRTVTWRVPVARSGVMSSRSMCAVATGSIHTVCQIPDDGVYQIPLGLLRCLPIGWLYGPPSVGSSAPTISSCGPVPWRALVTSTSKAV